MQLQARARNRFGSSLSRVKTMVVEMNNDPMTGIAEDDPEYMYDLVPSPASHR